MVDYKKMYLEIFTASEKAIKLLTTGKKEDISLTASKASIILIEGQLKCEEIYISSKDSELKLIG